MQHSSCVSPGYSMIFRKLYPKYPSMIQQNDAFTQTVPRMLFRKIILLSPSMILAKLCFCTQTVRTLFIFPFFLFCKTKFHGTKKSCWVQNVLKSCWIQLRDFL